MRKHLVILLDETSVSYCRARNPHTTPKLMPLEALKASILWGMKENLMIQFVYPDYELPKDYDDAIESIDHIKIKPANQANADVVVCRSVSEINGDTAVLILSKTDLFEKEKEIASKLQTVNRLNVCIQDIESFSDEDFSSYSQVLETFVNGIFEAYENNIFPQLNILTDRILLDKMNNCEAGIENITIAPNGKFYLCPAFYYENEASSVGDVISGLQIKNEQLLKLDHAPLCRKCDAFHCNRCVWLNQRTTWDINTPSHEQCVVSHLERNASRKLLEQLKTKGFFEEKSITEISYLDPFEIRKEL